MRKYMIMAFFTLIFQGDIHCEDYNADLNKAIQEQLISARKVMQSKTVVEFDPILKTLVSFSQKGKIEKAAAIVRIKSIKAALEKYKSEQYPTYWSKWFGSTPEIVKNQINPALAKVENALKLLNATSMNTGYIVGGTVLGVVAALGIGGTLWYLVSNKNGVSSLPVDPEPIRAEANPAADSQLVLPDSVSSRNVSRSGSSDSVNASYWENSFPSSDDLNIPPRASSERPRAITKPAVHKVVTLTPGIDNADDRVPTVKDRSRDNERALVAASTATDRDLAEINKFFNGGLALRVDNTAAAARANASFAADAAVRVRAAADEYRGGAPYYTRWDDEPNRAAYEANADKYDAAVARYDALADKYDALAARRAVEEAGIAQRAAEEAEADKWLAGIPNREAVNARAKANKRAEAVQRSADFIRDAEIAARDAEVSANDRLALVENARIAKQKALASYDAANSVNNGLYTSDTRDKAFANYATARKTFDEYNASVDAYNAALG